MPLSDRENEILSKLDDELADVNMRSFEPDHIARMRVLTGTAFVVGLAYLLLNQFAVDQVIGSFILCVLWIYIADNWVVPHRIKLGQR